MKTTLLCCCFFCFALAFAQNQSFVFNKYSFADTSYAASVAIKTVSDGYIVVGDINAINGYSGTYMSKLNLKGEEEFSKILYGEVCYSAIYFGASLQETTDKNFVVIFNKGTQFADMNFVVVKFTENGEVLWTKVYERPHKQNGANLVKCSDGGFLIVGTSQQYYTPTSVAPAQVHVIKTDSQGEVLWENIYPANNIGPLYASQTADGGYIISGYQYNTVTGYDMYVLKIAAQGGVQWEKTYGTPVDDGGCNVQSYPLGGYYLLGLKWGGGVTKQLYIAWLDDAGNVIYSKSLTKNELFGIDANPIFSSDGSYKVVTLSYGPPPIWEVAFTTFNNSGDIVSEIPISSGLPGEDYIRDLEPTPDGGYILAGFNYTNPGSSWVVKLGPNGEYCGTAPCLDSLFVSSITPPPTTCKPPVQTHATVYPNPVPAGIGTAQISYSLPLQLPFGVWELYNVQGQKVRYQVLSAGGVPLNPLKGTFNASLDLEGISPGMYVWCLSLPGGYEQYEASGKLVVE
ncbi:T9SS C-terminal target domain-containing protein [Sphingobacteriales bacterium UPWRP_1]|nr:hypothetical protein B6N25_15795 [Sphingobacteriales bacterium TSM_CSS]PSJ74458.1 T9SS C-terminal target domain-containing protein [Sphingobacteriales bacterium UPWRP_1]